jgi:uncharacterized membrane protein YkvA (DUF1232 family)
MQELFDNGRLVLRLMGDARVPTWIKVGIPLFVALYFFSPVDLIPDFFLGLGQLDDLGVVLLGMSLMVRFAPRNVVEEHRRALGFDLQGDPTHRDAGYSPGPPTRPIDGEYKVVPPGEGEPWNTQTTKR